MRCISFACFLLKCELEAAASSFFGLYLNRGHLGVCLALFPPSSVQGFTLVPFPGTQFFPSHKRSCRRDVIAKF